MANELYTVLDGTNPTLDASDFPTNSKRPELMVRLMKMLIVYISKKNIKLSP